MEIAREADLLRLGGAEGGDAGELERQPQPERAEVTGQLGERSAGDGPTPLSPSGRI